MKQISSDADLIRDFLKKVAENIRNESIAQGRVATGRTINSLEDLVTTSLGGQLHASVNILRTEFGTSPKEALEESYNTLVEGLKEWMAAKGLKLNPYALAHKIRRQGTKLYREGGHSGVLTKFIQQNQLDQFTETLATKYLKETTSLLFS